MKRSMQLTSVLCLVAGSVAWGQPKMPRGGSLPNTVVRDEETSAAWAVWPAYQGFLPLELPKAGSKPAVQTPLAFMQKSFFATTHQEPGDDTYYLLVEGAQPGSGGQILAVNPLGWIPAEYLVLGTEAKQLERDVGDGTKQRIRGFHRKAIMVNTPALVKKDKTFTETVAVRRSPSSTGEVVLNLRLFTFFFIFAETESHALLGANNAFQDFGANTQPGAGAADVVLGWVPRERMVEWNSREALFWDHQSTLRDPALRDPLLGSLPRRTQPGRIWATPKDAFAARRDIWQNAFPVKDLSNDYRPQPIPVQENLNAETGESSPPEHNQMRHAILEGTVDKPYIDRLGAWRLYRVGALGDFVDAQGNRIATEQKVRRFTEELNRIGRQLAITEILFVVDDTSSMKPWFARTAEAISSIAGRVQEAVDKNAAVRAGVAYYNDLDPSRPAHPGYEVAPLVDLSRREEVETLMANLEKHGEKGGGGQPREMAFQGLSAALHAADFERYSQKFVVVIGDCGDRGGGPTVQDLIGQIRQLSPDTCFLAVHVPQAARIDRDGDMRAFRTEMQAIVNGLNQGLEHPLSAYANISDRQGFLQKIDDTYHALRRQQVAEQRQLEDAKKGGRLPSTKIVQLESQFAQDPEMLALIDHIKRQEGVQLFFDGYAWYYDGSDPAQIAKCDLRPYVLTTESELEQLQKLLLGIQRPRNAPDEINPDQLVGGAETTQSGEYGAAFSEYDVNFIVDRVGLRFRSKVFDQARERAKKRGQNDLAFDQQQLRILAHKADRITDAITGLKRRFWVRTETLNGVPLTRWDPIAGGEQANPRLWEIPGIKAPFKWIWLDQRNEWP